MLKKGVSLWVRKVKNVRKVAVMCNYAVTQLRALLTVASPVHKFVKVLYARRKKKGHVCFRRHEVCGVNRKTF